MKSSVLIILATLLTTAILAPAVITLYSQGEKIAITIDFNEEEKKEEKKEAKEKEFFVDHNLNYFTNLRNERVSISHLYLESYYSTSLSIVLPPPEHDL